MKKKRYHKERNWEYDFINFHRYEIFDLMPNKCKGCGEEEVKVIHHKEYGKTPKLKYRGAGAKEKNKPQLKKYVKKYLWGFCSNPCHRNYERNHTHKHL